LVPDVALLVHGVQDATVNGLETIAYVGQCAPHDHAHGVIEVALPHLVFDVDAYDFPGVLCHQASLAVLSRAKSARRASIRQRVLALEN
jgi:hypothetical protein